MFEQREQRNLGAIKSQKPVCRSRSNVRTRHGTMDWFKIGKGVCQDCILSPCLFNFCEEYIMQNTRLDRNQDCRVLLDEGEREEWKSWLKTQHTKTKIMASSPITSWQIEGGRVEAVTDFVFLGSKITADGNCSHKHLLLERKVMTNLDSIFKGKTSLCWQRSV